MHVVDYKSLWTTHFLVSWEVIIVIIIILLFIITYNCAYFASIQPGLCFPEKCNLI